MADISKKLRLKDGPMYLLKAPKDCEEMFSSMDTKTSLTGKAFIEQVVLFTEQRAVLDAIVPNLMPRLADEALFWVAYPKKSGNIKSDLTRDSFWDAFADHGYSPVMQVALDDNWSALRFRHDKAIGPKLRDVKQEDRKMEGVDFVNRKVTLPKDAADALKPYPHLKQYFKSLAFTHQKEYVQHIVEAKKPETRARRIEKMVALMEANSAKQTKKK
ncbi:MAG: YdeI/OmpD-associated family protein [Chitinophagales bacterium]|nr:YdeI/OmpD-associated family protein [Chitinophagales bacterium]